MGKVQLWQADGLGIDKETLERVLRIFRSDGVQGMKSQQALEAYIKKLDDSKLQEMCKIDKEAALQIMADCLGVAATAEKYSKWQTVLFNKAIDIQTRQIEELKAEAEENRKALEETRRKSNERIDALKAECANWARNCEDAQEEVRKLKEILAHYKADLYDFYARAGKMPRYETE